MCFTPLYSTRAPSANARGKLRPKFSLSVWRHPHILSRCALRFCLPLRYDRNGGKISKEIQRKEISRNMSTDRKRAQFVVGGHVTVHQSKWSASFWRTSVEDDRSVTSGHMSGRTKQGKEVRATQTGFAKLLKFWSDCFRVDQDLLCTYLTSPVTPLVTAQIVPTHLLIQYEKTPHWCFRWQRAGVCWPHTVGPTTSYCWQLINHPSLFQTLVSLLHHNDFFSLGYSN